MTIRTTNYMHTATGKKYYPLEPRADEVEIETIAHHLAMRARYNGATKDFISVAEHSFWVSMFEPHIDPLEKLLHDASEAYNGDLIRPLKYDASFSGPFKRVEDLNERAVAERFGLQYPFPASVKRADEAVTTAEIAQAIIKDPNDVWNNPLHDADVVAPITIQFWDWKTAKQMFLARFRAIMLEQDKRRREMLALEHPLMSA